MECLRCGVEIEESRSFCDSCRQEMAMHPVKPGTPVLILPREERTTDHFQKRKKKPMSRKQLRAIIHWLSGIIALLLVVIGVLVAMLLLNTPEAPQPQSNIGQNYNTLDETEPQ